MPPLITLLIVNPNSTAAMTEALKPVIEPLLPPHVGALFGCRQAGARALLSAAGDGGVLHRPGARAGIHQLRGDGGQARVAAEQRAHAVGQ